jgi:pimeloyl-ACP methyl ester carboxylesterase
MPSNAAPRSSGKSTTVRPDGIPGVPSWIKKGFQLTGAIAPGTAAAAADWLFFRPHTRRRSGTTLGAKIQSISIDEQTVETYSWGASGRTVLLVHGWAGRATQMAPLGAALASAGYRAIAFDLPAHGGSSGKTTNLLEVERVARVVAGQAGSIHAVVGHSFGGIAAMLAVVEGLAADRVAVLGAPATVTFLAHSFADHIGLGERATTRFLDRIEGRFGPETWRRFSPTRLSQEIAADALIVHDVDDRVVPYEQALELSRAWPGSAQMTTTGLGHNRILQNQDVLDAVVEFVDNGGRHATSAD